MKHNTQKSPLSKRQQMHARYGTFTEQANFFNNYTYMLQ